MSTPKSPRYNQEQAELTELCGCQDWQEVIEWFGGMTEEEILAEANRCWGGDDNREFARRIHEELS